MTDSGNITKLPKRAQSSTERSRRSRQRKADAAAAAAAAAQRDATPAQAPATLPAKPAAPGQRDGITPQVSAGQIAADPATRRRGRGTNIALAASALVLAACGARLEIEGWVTVFAGGQLEVTILAGAFIGAQLAATAYLARGGDAPRWLKAAAVVLVVAMVCFNTVGAFARLLNLNASQIAADDASVAYQVAAADAAVSAQAAVVDDLNHQIAVIDGAVASDTVRGRSRSALEIADQRARQRAGLVDRRQAEFQRLGEAKLRLVAAGSERHRVDANFGPLLNLAALLGAAPQTVFRTATGIIALLIDPASILLLACACHRGGRPR